MRPRYDADLLAAFELDTAELPAIARAGDRAGHLTNAGSALAGLPTGIPVAVGTGDDFSNMLGAGLVAPGRVGVGLGAPARSWVRLAILVPLIDSEDMVRDPRLSGRRLLHREPRLAVRGAVAWLVGVLNLRNAAELDALRQPPRPDRRASYSFPASAGQWRRAGGPACAAPSTG